MALLRKTLLESTSFTSLLMTPASRSLKLRRFGSTPSYGVSKAARQTSPCCFLIAAFRDTVGARSSGPKPYVSYGRGAHLRRTFRRSSVMGAWSFLRRGAHRERAKLSRL